MTLIELVVDLTANGIKKAYKQKFRVNIESICQLLNLVALYFYLESQGFFVNIFNDSVFKSLIHATKILEVVVYIRVLKIISMLYEIKELRVIMITMQQMVEPLMGLILVQCTIFYITSNIMMGLFGGKIYPTQVSIQNDSSIPKYYYLMNFNDLASSWVTLFALVIVNNWFIIVQMYVDATEVPAVRWLFIMFYYFGVVIGINILIAFAIDMYSSVERMDADYSKN